jgi:hypothetical protein
MSSLNHWYFRPVPVTETLRTGLVFSLMERSARGNVTISLAARLVTSWLPLSLDTTTEYSPAVAMDVLLTVYELLLALLMSAPFLFHW